MAILNIRDENRLIESTEAVRRFLARYGIQYRHVGELDLDNEAPTKNEILTGYSRAIQEFQAGGECTNVELVELSTDSPSRHEELLPFEQEHAHLEDEVRIVVRGRGLFHINPEGGSVFSIEVRAGDSINIPRGTRHWFRIPKDETVCLIRLFSHSDNLLPEYTGSGVEKLYAPLFVELMPASRKGARESVAPSPARKRRRRSS